MTNTNELTDKCVLFLTCFIIYLVQPIVEFNVIPILFAVIIGSLLSYFENIKIRIILILSFLILSMLITSLILFMPLMFYDIFYQKYQLLMGAMTVPIIISLSSLESTLSASILVLCFMSLWLKYRTISLDIVKVRYDSLGDDAREMSDQLKIQNKELLEKMDIDINFAMLKERNRIAREIHDNVGHQLSSAILQIGALLTISKEEKMQTPLILVNNTLSEAMTSIRESVHDLHDQSLDLHLQLETLFERFYFCEVIFEDQLRSQPNKKIKLAFISITKEALSNIMKHSNATRVYILLREHPAFYQFIIRDNGTIDVGTSDSGIGLLNMSDRVQAINGNINFHRENGFEIFISIPKEESY